ncbi:MAG: ABC transporter permease [Solirubrobacteraceae bacterium]|jgi:simple sugar transport system permease protein
MTDMQLGEVTPSGGQLPEASVSSALDPRRTIASAVGSSIRELALLPALAAIMIAGTIASPAFLTSSNLTTVVQFSAALGLLVVAESLILIFGELDLSLQSVYGLAPMLAAWWTVHPNVRLGVVGSGTDLPPVVGLLVLLAVGAIVGLVNSTLVVKFKMNAFILGLAMLILLAGLQQGIPNDATVYSLPAAFTYIGAHDWLGVPVAAWIEVAVFVGVGLFMRYHRAGRAIYAIGGNIEAARAAGIKVDRIRISCWVFAGVLAAVAGLMTAGQVDAVTANQGATPGIIFTVFAAAVIGGISLDGGKGRMVGAFTGVLLLSLVQNVLTLANVSSFWISAADGAIIVLVLLVTRGIGSLQGRSRPW